VPLVLKDAVQRLLRNPTPWGYGSLRSQGRRLLIQFSNSKNRHCERSEAIQLCLRKEEESWIARRFRSSQ
jgi:hypothetical protein